MAIRTSGRPTISTPIAFRLTPTMHAQLDAIARKEGNPLSSVARRMLAECLSREQQTREQQIEC